MKNQAFLTKPSQRLLPFAGLLAVLSAPAAYSASFLGLGDLTGTGFYSEAMGISADGLTIVGTGNHNGRAEAWRAQLDAAPVPIPAAVWLFGSALAGLGMFGRRKASMPAKAA